MAPGEFDDRTLARAVIMTATDQVEHQALLGTWSHALSSLLEFLLDAGLAAAWLVEHLHVVTGPGQRDLQIEGNRLVAAAALR